MNKPNYELIKILLAWWDFMDEDNTAQRREYTEAEQNELIFKFFNQLNQK